MKSVQDAGVQGPTGVLEGDSSGKTFPTNIPSRMLAVDLLFRGGNVAAGMIA